jgi:hypothetical protein
MMAKGASEKVISKEDAARIFGFTKNEWDFAAPTFITPALDIRFAKHETGVHVIGFDPDTG